ncbi:hypothetical protein C1A38_22450 [Verrucosispora sp. ts21]|uniref:hypothetical protein n=1 Tax=Verrucosispora sp. ts21 TaxID=2069341 RepID=UPI000C88D84B|nr:hypothetical protein [Verrucosispora sp. ts21]PMR58853.1 hypothetical protein C1A38_22450 [Verrucosispora sp. ts21]
MTAASSRDRVLEALRLSSRPLDDDQLSQRTGVRPRQQVNQICRALQLAGAVRRWEGPDGKIVNELVERTDGVLAEAPRTPHSGPLAPAAVVRTLDDHLPAGHSAEQRHAERVMLDLLGRDLALTLEPAKIAVPSGARVEIDGCDSGRTVLVECWAHQGPPKSAQRHKVLADALKLTWIASTMYPRPRLVLCMSDPAAARPFQPTSRTWAAQALLDLAITVHVVEIPDDIRQKVRAAQERQYR